MTGKVTAREVRRRIATKWGNPSQAITTPEHLVLSEVTVPDAATPSHEDRHGNRMTFGSRRVDVLAVGMWAKTRYLTHGFEIKVSRSDLLAELADPTKAAAGMAICDRWWLALGDPALLRDGDELPESWGIVGCRGRGLTVIREPDPDTEAIVTSGVASYCRIGKTWWRIGPYGDSTGPYVWADIAADPAARVYVSAARLAEAEAQRDEAVLEMNIAQQREQDTEADLAEKEAVIDRVKALCDEAEAWYEDESGDGSVPDWVRDFRAALAVPEEPTDA